MDAPVAHHEAVIAHENHDGAIGELLIVERLSTRPTCSSRVETAFVVDPPAARLLARRGSLAVTARRVLSRVSFLDMLGIGLVRPVGGGEGHPEEEGPLGGLGAVQKGDHVVGEELLRVPWPVEVLGNGRSQLRPEVRSRATPQPGADVGKPPVTRLRPPMACPQARCGNLAPASSPGRGRQTVEAVGVLHVGMLILISIPPMPRRSQAGQQSASLGEH